MLTKVYRDGVEAMVDLVEIGGGHLLEKEAAADFLKMDAACFAATGCHLIVNEAWRSYEHQKALKAKYDKDLQAWMEGGQKGPRPLRPSRPGFSKHEPGEAVDIDMLADNGHPHPYVPWLKLHARDYNFTNPIGKEPWHHEHMRK